MKCRLKENIDDILLYPAASWVKKVKKMQDKNGFITIKDEITKDKDYEIVGSIYNLSPDWIDIIKI